MGSNISRRHKSANATNPIQVTPPPSSKPAQSASTTSTSTTSSTTKKSRHKGKPKKDSLSVQPRPHRASNSCSSNSYTFIKRVNALNKILRVCQEEQEHWTSVLATLRSQECDSNDEHTRQCLYIVSFWSRQFVPSFARNTCTSTTATATATEDKSSRSDPFRSIVAYYDPPQRGLFGHCKKEQFEAYKQWAYTRSEWVRHKTSLMEAIKDELMQYEMDWDSNTQKKKHWRCQICKHSNIQDIFIEHEQDTSYDYNYKRECSKTDFQFAYNVMISCKTKRISLDTGKLVPCHHSMYLHHNLRKYQVVPRFVMHRCRACNHNHTFVDTQKHRECDHCHHEHSKHDQVWCKHADEFDGSEEIVTRKVKDVNGNWT